MTFLRAADFHVAAPTTTVVVNNIGDTVLPLLAHISNSGFHGSSST